MVRAGFKNGWTWGQESSGYGERLVVAGKVFNGTLSKAGIETSIYLLDANARLLRARENGEQESDGDQSEDVLHGEISPSR